MSGRAEGVAARARALVGTRFRLQGRSAAEGLDCVGAAALAVGVPAERVRRDYALRGTRIEALEAEMRALGLVPKAGEAEAGDVAIFLPGPEQLHLAICTGSSFVHADAGLGRVVERPAPAPWPVLAVWRLKEGE